MKFPTLLECLTSKRLEVEALAKRAIQPNFDMLQEKWQHESVLAIELYSQPLALWMFIPCGEDGIPIMLELPKATDADFNHAKPTPQNHRDYLEAQIRLLFKGWELIECGFDMLDSAYVVQCGQLIVEFIGDNIEVELNKENILHNPNIYEFTNDFFTNLTPSQSAINHLNLT